MPAGRPACLILSPPLTLRWPESPYVVSCFRTGDEWKWQPEKDRPF